MKAERFFYGELNKTTFFNENKSSGIRVNTALERIGTVGIIVLSMNDLKGVFKCKFI
ncbi:hypothetical protein MY9_2065 [Bacillus sp. JS]|nr:hypothetical protein MY9_2065 [Bacillus sp. JS]GFM13713.1 uncharacterized protein FW1_contig-04-59 [Bacillus sp. FW1]